MKERNIVIILCFVMLFIYTLYDHDALITKESFEIYTHETKYNSLQNQYKEITQREKLMKSELENNANNINREMLSLEINIDKLECAHKSQYLVPAMKQMFINEDILTVPKIVKKGTWDKTNNTCVPPSNTNCPPSIECISKYNGKMSTGFNVNMNNMCTYPSCASYCYTQSTVDEETAEETSEETSEETEETEICLHV